MERERVPIQELALYGLDAHVIGELDNAGVIYLDQIGKAAYVTAASLEFALRNYRLGKPQKTEDQLLGICRTELNKRALDLKMQSLGRLRTMKR